jgi:hypothetical protein
MMCNMRRPVHRSLITPWAKQEESVFNRAGKTAGKLGCPVWCSAVMWWPTQVMSARTSLMRISTVKTGVLALTAKSVKPICISRS